MPRGANKITWVGKNWDPVAMRPNGAFTKGWDGDSTAKSARLCLPIAGTKKLSAISAYTPGTTIRGAWWVLNGYDVPGNTIVRAKAGTPVDAVKFNNIELTSMDLFVAPAQGATPQLCVIITEGSNQPAAERGRLAWGTPNEGTFTGANNPRAVAFGSDVFVLNKNLTNEVPFVEFIVNC